MECVGATRPRCTSRTIIKLHPLHAKPIYAACIFGIPGFLTHCNTWAGSFHELLTLDTPHTDALMHLPNAPLPTEVLERRRLRLLFEQEMASDKDATAAARAGRRVAPPALPHCSANVAPERACAAKKGVTVKQRNQMRVFAGITHTPMPSSADIDSMTKEEAGQWIHKRWSVWVQHGHAALQGQ